MTRPSAAATAVSAELFGAGGNNAIVRMPGRRFPGMLVQGDTLASLVMLARMAKASRSAPNEDFDHLHERLEGMLRDYAATITAAGMELPYSLDPPGDE